jgi:tRNA (mo5U34)-methyltransferase
MNREREKEWLEKSYLKQDKSDNTQGAKAEEGSVEERVNQISWRHQIPLKNGQTTNGTKDSSLDLQEFQLPEDLFKDKTVADVGACDGFFSFYAEQNGAKDVLAIDPYRWTLDNRWSGMEGFNLAREINESKVKDSVELLENLSPETVGEWDVSLFLGVFYHLVDPVRILQNVASITKETLVVETINAEFWGARYGYPIIEQDSNKYLHPFIIEKPLLLYYPENEVDGDYTTWYAPNPKYIEDMLRVEGFKTFDTKRIYSNSRFITTARR